MAVLDKFYTKPEIATQCIEIMKKYIELDDVLEPSAGDGSFSNQISDCIALDIAPENENIVKQDFFTFDQSVKVVIGNPPFGKRSALAVDFFNHATQISKWIGFIVPVSFMKWSVQKQLNNEWHLVHCEYLPIDSFTDREKDFSIRTVFQIWTIEDIGVDLRLKKAPPIKHPDFEIWQYNATPQAMSTIDEDWTYAVYRQGYHDYNEIFSQESKEYIRSMMDGSLDGKKKQFFFIKPLTAEADKVIRSMDFNALAERNTSTPGFGKGDFVSYYIELTT